MDGMPAEGAGLPAIGAEIAGKYRIESVLGRGGMGAVFAARNMLTGKRVAIKWLLPEHAATSTQERLLREAQIAASIDHPNVVDIYDVGEHQGGAFLVMEYLRGKPLSDVLAERGRLDPEELIALIVPAMRGVHAAHQAGVVHRDLKPENIFLSESDGQLVPKVVDFGVSKSMAASSVPVSSLTRTGALVGTPHYMALEQVDGTNAIDVRTDVYAFGVLVYRALTGHFPFDGTSLGEVILKIGTKEPAPMRELRPELPAGLDAVVMRAISRDRTLRFPDLEQFARALTPYDGLSHSHSGGYDLRSLTPGAVSFRPLRGGGSGDPPAQGSLTPNSAVLARPTLERGKRMRAMLIGAVVALALMGAGAIMLLRRDGGLAGPDSVLARPHTTQLVTQPAEAIPAPSSVRPEAPVGTNVVPALAQPAAQALAETPSAATGVAALTDEVPSGLLAPQPSDAATVEATPTAAPLAEAPSRAVGVDSASIGARPGSDAAVSGRSGSLRVWKQKRTPAAPEVPAPTDNSPARTAPQLIPGERTNGLSVDEF